MAFQWGDYLQLASRLAGAPDEASRRSAISRAYYAVYNLAVGQANSHGVTIVRVQGFGPHEACWNAYMCVPAVTRIGVAGDRLKVRRRKADYELVALNWAKEAASAIAEAQGLIAAL
jgi:hypothetical protein